MRTTQKIEIDLAVRGVTETVQAVQGDDNSRTVEITLKENGEPTIAPETTTGIVRYRRADGVGGNYDTTRYAGAAVSFSENVVSVKIEPEVLAAPGVAEVAVAMVNGEQILHTFVFNIDVQRNPGLNALPNGGAYLAGTVPDSGWEPNKFLGTDAQGKVVAKNATENSGSGGHGNITVVVDEDTMTANYTNTQIIEHLENGGTARVKLNVSGAYFQLYGIVGTTVMFGAPAVNEGDQVELVIYSIWTSGSVTKDVFPIGSGESTGKPISGFKITEGENGAFSMEIQFTDGTSDTFGVPAGEKPAQVTYNGVAIPIEWAVSE